jgi:hypothetical protein
VPGQGLDEKTIIDTLPGMGFQHLMGPNRHRWLGFVESFEGTRFSEPGDSGSLVYTMKGSVKVPLGIHIGRPGAYGCRLSMFQSLECHILAADLYKDLSLRFDHWE